MQQGLSNGSIAPSTVIDEKFQIEQVLGEGAMGVVVRALHLKLGTPVALKFLLPRFLGDRVIVERFAREARAAARLTSEHVARVLDVGNLSTGAPYLVMEYLSGETLAERLKRRGTLPVAEACAYMLQVCDALTEAHGLDIIHRDLKPANLFLATRSNGRTVVKVLDFGISKMGSIGGDELTVASSILGTPLYMAPEQISSSRSVDGRADVWSCGICLHSMLAGKVPFEASSIVELGAKLLKDTPARLDALRPDVPNELADVVLRCLEHDVTRRWQSAADLAAALERFGGRISTGSGSSPAMMSGDGHEDPTVAMVRAPLHGAGSQAASTPSESALTVASAVAPVSIVEATLSLAGPLPTPPPAPTPLGVMRPSARSGSNPPPNTAPVLEAEEPTRVVPPLTPMRNDLARAPMPTPIPMPNTAQRHAPTAPAGLRPPAKQSLEQHPYFGVGLVVAIALVISMAVLLARSAGCFGRATPAHATEAPGR